MFIDSHAHLSSAEMLVDIDEVVQRAKAASIVKVVNICTDKETLEQGLKLQNKYPNFIVNTGATTPHDVEKEGEKFFSLFEQVARNNKLVAIGETGLDYFYEHSNRDLQKEFLVRYMELAKELDLALVIHCREAFQDLFSIADEFYPSCKAILHCFTGTIDEAKQVVDRGWMLSLSGIVTFKKSHDLREVAKIVPVDQLLIETDAPYLAPQTKRGKRNEPAFVVETAKVIADQKQIHVEELAEHTTKNAAKIFSFKTTP